MDEKTVKGGRRCGSNLKVLAVSDQSSIQEASWTLGRPVFIVETASHGGWEGNGREHCTWQVKIMSCYDLKV